jgi:hypothetical protein
MSTIPLQLPAGSVALRIRVFGPADQELAATVAPPWPRWMRRLYELHALGSSHSDTVAGDIGVAAALAALQVRIGHRLQTIGFVCAHLEELGWEIALAGPDLIIHRLTVPEAARGAMDQHHLTGALLAVADVDERGRVRFYEPAEIDAATGGGMARRGRR